MTADLIILNARVLTMDDSTPRAGAVALQGNRILAVGDTSAIRALAGPQTRIIDAQGGTADAGFCGIAPASVFRGLRPDPAATG